MINFSEYLYAFVPWLGFIGFVLFSVKMTVWARKRKTTAIAFGLALQMFLPDPRAQKSIESVIEVKQEVKKQQLGESDPDDRDEHEEDLVLKKLK
jgi:hypothetical protein